MKISEHTATLPMNNYNYLMNKVLENRQMRAALNSCFILNHKTGELDVNIPNLLKEIRQYLPEQLQELKYNLLGV